MENLAVLCHNINEEGKPCQQELLSRFKMCPMCGGKVDPAWFLKGYVYDLFIHSRKKRRCLLILHTLSVLKYSCYLNSLYNAHKSFAKWYYLADVDFRPF